MIEWNDKGNILAGISCISFMLKNKECKNKAYICKTLYLHINVLGYIYF